MVSNGYFVGIQGAVIKLHESLSSECDQESLESVQLSILKKKHVILMILIMLIFFQDIVVQKIANFGNNQFQFGSKNKWLHLDVRIKKNNHSWV